MRHAIRQADHALHMAGLGEQNIFRQELRTHGEDVERLLDAVELLRQSQPPHMCWRNKKERRAYEALFAAAARLKALPTA